MKPESHAVTRLECAELYDAGTLNSIFFHLTEAGPAGAPAPDLYVNVRQQVDVDFGEGKYTYDVFESDLHTLVCRGIISSTSSAIRRIV